MCGLLFIAVTLLREAGRVLWRCDRRHSSREDFFPHSLSLLHHAHHHQVKANQRPQLVNPEMLVTPYHNSSILLPFCPACPPLIFSSHTPTMGHLSRFPLLTYPSWNICPIFRSSHTHHGKFIPFVFSSHTHHGMFVPFVLSSHTHHGTFVPFVLSSHTQYCFLVHTTLHTGASLLPLKSAWT